MSEKETERIELKNVWFCVMDQRLLVKVHDDM